MRTDSSWVTAGFALVVCVTSFGREGGAAEPIGPARALSVIRANEDNQRARIRNAQWAFVLSSGRMPKADDSDGHIPDPADPKLTSKRKVYFEPESGRYRLDIEGVSKWTHGDDNYLSFTSTYSFDGRSERTYERSSGGTKGIPVSQPGSGKISWEKKNAFIDKWGPTSGIGDFPPYYFNRQLSDFLTERQVEKQPVNVSQESDGNWTIATVPANPAHQAAGETFRIRYDPVRGIVSWAEWIGNPKDKSAWAGKAFMRHSVRWREIESGIWVPDRITRTNLIDKTSDRFEFRDMRINQPVDEAVYRITFPVGTRLVDEIEKKSYVVSNGAIDEQEAVREFMKIEELRENASPSWWRRNTNLAVFSGLGLATTALAVFFVRRRRVARAVALSVALGILFSQSACAAEPDDAGSWRVSHALGETYPISQCGLNVSVFALEYYNVSYQLKRVSVALPPTEEGIRCLDIKHVLEAHGLDVVSRDQVPLSQLGRVVQPGVLAIFPVRTSDGRNHYLIAMDHEKRGRIIIDAPRKVIPFDDKSLTEGQFQSCGGVVLFVRRPKTPPARQSDAVTITPAVDDLGEFKTGTPEYSKAVRRTFVVENTSKRAVMVRALSSPCGCLQVKWDGGVIGSGERVELPVTINPGGWGWGRVTRDVTLVFADGSEAVARLTANTPRPEQAHQLSVSPEVIRVRLSEGARGQVSRNAVLLLDPSVVSQVQIGTNAKWLTAQVAGVKDGQADLTVTIDARHLPESAGSHTGDVTLSTRPGEAPVLLRVIVSHDRSFTIDPVVLTCARGSEGLVVVRPLPGVSVEDSTPFSVLAAPEGISATRVAGTAPGELRIKVACTTASRKGLTQIDCRMGAAGSQTDFRIYVRVD